MKYPTDERSRKVNKQMGGVSSPPTILRVAEHAPSFFYHSGEPRYRQAIRIPQPSVPNPTASTRVEAYVRRQLAYSEWTTTRHDYDAAANQLTLHGYWSHHFWDAWLTDEQWEAEQHNPAWKLTPQDIGGMAG